MAKRRGNGEGSIVKRKDGKWQGYVTVGYDPESEKPKKKYFYSSTRKEIQEKITDALGKVQAGTYREPLKLKLAEWLNTWLNDYMKPSLRPTTWGSYEVQIKKHILPTLGHLRLSQLQTSNLQALYNQKLNGGRADGKEGGLSPRSVRYIHVVIHAALEQAKKEGMITFNVADAVKLPKEEKKEIQCFNTQGVKIFLTHARKTKYFPAYFLALNTGLRRGELLGLRWKDVDLEGNVDIEGSVSVTQGLVRVNGGLKFQEPKTKLSQRTISVSKEVVKELKAHKTVQQKQKLSAGAAYERNWTLFSVMNWGNPFVPEDLPGITKDFLRQLAWKK